MTVAEKLVALLKAQGLTCATAESCTGAVFAGGIISYANEVKRDVLGVAAQALDEYGAVSPQVAAQMAEGARRLLKTDLAVSLTGIAGPDGGSDEKPVGLVWFGLATKDGVRTEKAIFRGDRAKVREQAITHALGMLTIGAA